MNRYRYLVVTSVVLLGVAGLVGAGPVRAEEAAQSEVGLGIASAKRSADRVAAMLQEVTDRFGKQANECGLEELEQFGPQVMEGYDALRVPLEVVAVQSAALAADRVSLETAMIDGMALLKERSREGFGANEADMDRLHAQKIAWSEVVLALGIAKCTGKKADDLVAQAKGGKTWPEVAVAAGLQAGKLTELLKPMFRQ